jgi:ubiquitin-conjugating enzyme E2 S
MMNGNARMLARLQRELKQLATQPPEGVRFVPMEDMDSLVEIHVELDGPEETPYEGGTWRLKLVLGPDYPQAPPRGFFLTKIYHPNVSANGDICVNTLKKDWSESVTLSHTLAVIRCLLIIPFPESSLNDEAGKLFMDSYELYAERARMMTQVHALRRSSTSAATSASPHTGGRKRGPSSKASPASSSTSSSSSAASSASSSVAAASSSQPLFTPVAASSSSSSRSAVAASPLSTASQALNAAPREGQIVPGLAKLDSAVVEGAVVAVGVAAGAAAAATTAAAPAASAAATTVAHTAGDDFAPTAQQVAREAVPKSPGGILGVALSDKSNSKKSPCKSPSGKRDKNKKRRLSRL